MSHMASFAVQFHEPRVLAVFIRIILHQRDHKHKDREQLVLFFSFFVSIITGVKGLLDFFLTSVLFLLVVLVIKSI